MIKSRVSFKPQVAIDEPTVNLTPLIDVVFVILIIFIVIAPLLELDQVALADHSRAPIEQSQSVQDKSPITLHVHQDNTIWFNKELIDAQELTRYFRQAKDAYPKAVPQIFQDKRAQFGTYQAVKNAAEEAGFSEIAIILKPA